MLSLRTRAHVASAWAALALQAAAVAALLTLASRGLYAHSDPGLVFLFYLLFQLASDTCAVIPRLSSDMALM